MSQLTDGLNDAQARAVLHVDGPLLILAGPGSGKTRVVTHRIAHLVTAADVPAHAVLAVTFTNKAAEEMQHRLQAMLDGPTPTTGTFHRFCARTLRQFGTRVGLAKNFTIVDQDDRLQLVTKVVKELGLDTAHFPPRRIEHRISQLKNELIGPEDFAAGVHDFSSQIVADAYPKYQERLHDSNAADFDDLLMLMVKLLEEHEDVRRQLDYRYRYVLVDEYQDTNVAQYRIARALCRDVRNLCVTGDPDQSIYSWRGANPKNVFDFQRDYPDTEIVRLEENYRSTKRILLAADGLIRKNAGRLHKELRTQNPEGAGVHVLCHANDDAEAHFVAESIRQGVDEENRTYRDFAVFVRTSALFGRLETALRARHIPYQVVGGPSFFQRKEVKDLLAYARLACNARDDAAFDRVVNTPARGLGETTLDRLRLAARRERRSLLDACRTPGFTAAAGIKGKQRAALEAFADLIGKLEAVASGPPHAALRLALELADYRASVPGGDEEEVQERLDNLDGVIHDAEQFAAEEPDAGLADFLEMVGLTGAVDERDGRADVATVMTLHAAKGLEFPVVHIVGFEQGVLPHERALEHNDLEEERRLAFVGVTRAREVLYLNYAAVRAIHGRVNLTMPSQFLDEMPAEALERRDRVRPTLRSFEREDYSQESGFEEPAIQIRRKASAPSSADKYRPGMTVEHPRYGRGQIVDVEGVGAERKATIRFADFGQKRFVLEKAPLEVV